MSLGRLSNWALSRSLWTYTIYTGCCADEIFEAKGCRYDLERFGVMDAEEPEQADLLLVFGSISPALLPEVQNAYASMKEPKYVMAIGACACSGGLFSSVTEGGGVDRSIPVDIYIPGCPPRPESILRGLIALQEKILAG